MPHPTHIHTCAHNTHTHTHLGSAAAVVALEVPEGSCDTLFHTLRWLSNGWGKKGVMVSASPCFQGEQPFWLKSWPSVHCSEDEFHQPRQPEDLLLIVCVAINHLWANQPACSLHHLMHFFSWRSCWRSISYLVKGLKKMGIHVEWLEPLEEIQM